MKSCEDLWFSLQSCRSSTAPGQQGEEGGWRQARGGHEEGGQGHLRAEDAVAGPGGDLRQEGDAAHRGDEADLGLHQEEGAALFFSSLPLQI